MLRLAVDARDLASDTRGIGRYARAILRRLIRRDGVELTLLVRGPFVRGHRAKLHSVLHSDRFLLARGPRRDHVVWHPANGTFFNGGARSVVTIHDAVPFRFPHPGARARHHQQAPFLRSAAQAARVIAPSQFGKREIVEVFSLPEGRVLVIPHGVEPFFSPASGAQGSQPTRKPYLLFVGDPLAEPRKNFGLLYRAYCRAFPEDAPPLVVVGGSDPKLPRVEYAGHARGDASGEGDAALRSLYRDALALCMPSYYETFGMPMVEAMACGTPVIASNASCLPEIGGDAARYAPPHDEDGWACALSEVVNSSAVRDNLRSRGLQRARIYTWDESAQRHAEVFLSE